jgi:hypothetical protein
MREAAYRYQMAAHYFRMWFPVMMACDGDHGREIEVMHTNPDRIKYDEVMRVIREESERSQDRVLADVRLLINYTDSALDAFQRGVA